MWTESGLGNRYCKGKGWGWQLDRPNYVIVRGNCVVCWWKVGEKMSNETNAKGPYVMGNGKWRWL
jgi:hypothetical protein